MAKKAVKSKKSYKKTKYGKQKGKSYGTSTMVNKTSAKLHTLVAPKYLTKVTTNMSGFTNSTSTNDAGGGTSFAVSGNSIYLPFAAGNINSSAAITQAIDHNGSVGDFALTVLSNASAKNSYTIQPFGFTSVLLNMYRQFRIMGTKLKITVIPRVTQSSESNSFEICVYPYRIHSGADNETLITSFSLPVRDITQAQNMPYSKYKLFQYGDNVKDNTIEIYMHSHTILGMKKSEYRIRKDVVVQFENDNDSSATLEYVPTQQQWAYGVIVSDFDAGSGAPTQMNVSIELTSWVVCENPVQNFEND